MHVIGCSGAGSNCVCICGVQVLDVVLDVWYRTDDDILLFRCVLPHSPLSSPAPVSVLCMLGSVEMSSDMI